MSQSRSTFVLFNPAAGRGRGARRREAFQALLDRHLPGHQQATSQYAGHEIELVDRALEAGYDTIVAVGGDGTWSVTADRVVRSGRADVALGLLPAGTGCDFGKSLGITWSRLEAAVVGIARRRTRVIDVGRVEGRHFLNVVGFGFDIAVIDDADGFPLLRGDVLYQFCALRQLFHFGGVRLELSNAAGSSLSRDALMLVIANANYFGGSFHIAPRARLDDGQLDAVCIGNGGPLRRVRLFRLVGKGRHEGHPNVDVQQAAAFGVTFAQPVRYEVDGEVVTSQDRSLWIESVPRALTVCLPED